MFSTKFHCLEWENRIKQNQQSSSLKIALELYEVVAQLRRNGKLTHFAAVWPFFYREFLVPSPEENTNTIGL